jgi:Amt family ammonium transporter
MSGLVCLFAIMLVPLAAAGLALIHQGLGRSRSAAHAMLATLCVVGVAAIVFVLVGFAWAGYPSGAVHAFTARGVRWDWLGAGSFLGRDVPVAAMLSLCLQMFCVGIAGLIPLSAGTDRWRLGAICLSTAFLAGCCYPLFSHWVWGGGWLAGMTANLGLPGFLDVGGAGVVQVFGGGGGGGGGAGGGGAGGLWRWPGSWGRGGASTPRTGWRLRFRGTILCW